jgi:hypothetical protein
MPSEGPVSERPVPSAACSADLGVGDLGVQQRGLELL